MEGFSDVFFVSAGVQNEDTVSSVVYTITSKLQSAIALANK